MFQTTGKAHTTHVRCATLLPVNLSVSGVAVAWRPAIADRLQTYAASGRLGFTEVIAENTDPAQLPQAVRDLGVPVIAHGVTLGLAGADRPATDRLTLQEALTLLTPRQRAVLVLRFYEDLTETQAAAALGISPNTIKSQTRVALERLRALVPDLVATFEGVES